MNERIPGLRQLESFTHNRVAQAALITTLIAGGAGLAEYSNNEFNQMDALSIDEHIAPRDAVLPDQQPLTEGIIVRLEPPDPTL